jgi:hypothetical protein
LTGEVKVESDRSPLKPGVSPRYWYSQPNIIGESTMEPSTIVQLRVQLEALKKFEHLNAPNRFSYFGYLGELFIGVIILGQLLITKGLENITIFGIPHFAEWALFIISVVLISHSLYLIFRYHSDKRLRKVLEKILADINQQPQA